jgi:hypothetical protein
MRGVSNPFLALPTNRAAKPGVHRSGNGPAGTQATQVYLHADLALKEAALARTSPAAASRVRYRPPDHLLAFLEGL